MNKKPNIVFILSDDQGPFSLGCLNNSELKTPALDELAQNGVRFSHCFCASPVCSPARASILTGSIPQDMVSMIGFVQVILIQNHIIYRFNKKHIMII